MIEKPILFSTPMVKAIIEGRKSQTRRIVKDQKWLQWNCPYGNSGDRLWVRETWALHPEKEEILYKATNTYAARKVTWKPSIHMLKVSARIWLEVEEVRVERLQEITDEGAVAEGAMTLGLYPGYNISPRGHFNGLWTSIHGPESWEQNPFVWVVKFKHIEP